MLVHKNSVYIPRHPIIFVIFALAMLLAGCGDSNLPTGVTAPEITSSVTVTQPSPNENPTDTPIPTPTLTPEPLAAVVNGEPITMAEFQEELGRYRQAVQSKTGTNLATEGVTEEMIVLEYLIDQVLLAQGAVQDGFVVDNNTVDVRYEELAAQTDLPAWLAANGYSESSFRKALATSIKSTWMRDQIISAVASTSEQVHARQILLYNSEEANQVYANLQAGADFEQIAAAYRPIDKGDIGWFPRGFLTEKAIEEAAFNLQPGEISPIIETRLGFHILKIIERDPERLLEPEPLLVLQEQAIQRWLEEQKAESEIEALLP